MIKRVKFRLAGLGALILILSAILITGCDSGGSYTIFAGSISQNETSIEGSYKHFDGYYFRSLDLEKGDTVRFNLGKTTESGSLSIQLKKEDIDAVFIIENDTLVEIEQSGTYKVEALGNSHQGDFQLTWQTN